ncbi:sulfide:quinone oxidoreductase, mitochondrial [Culicoides brevitarsis]|uniref:sulfide:quinone oxidoreductase, mitochondrial n=1 Tax=Culicoides brevitarsis TaxID=469753 RepID=UPI00307BC158
MNSLKVVNIALRLSRSQVRAFSVTSNNYESHKCKLLIVGGGAGGSAEAAKFTKTLGTNQVIVLEPKDKHYYQPLFTLVGGGMKTLSQTWRPMSQVLPSAAKWIRDAASEFDPKNNTVLTENGDKIEYDFLIIATGLVLHYDKIPGLLEALSEPNGPVCSNYSPKYVDRTFAAFKNFKEGNAVFTFPNSPLKCPGAPQKVMYLFDEYARKTNKRKSANIIYNTTLPNIFGVKHYADALWKICEKRDLKVNLRTNLVKIYPHKKQALFENMDNPEQKMTLDYELLHVTPPQSTPDCLRNNKELTNELGFVDVNKDTLQHVKFSNIFAIGDCSSSPNSKTAASVGSQSKVVHANLLAVMNGKKPSAVYNGYASCPLTTGYWSCIMAEFDYSLTPLESFPLEGSKERLTMMLMKREFLPFLYWQFLVKGLWNGPGWIRKLLVALKLKEKNVTELQLK